MRFIAGTTAVFATLWLTACSNTYLLTSQFVASTQAGKAPEIIETPFYLTERTKIRTVAVRAPDSCSNRTADEASGSAASQGTILQTNCGVEMAEVEKALAKMGYRVISWKVLAKEMGKTQSATDSAAALGAEVVFQINSLEKSQKTLGNDARWERKYYVSDDYGAKLEEKAFDDATRTFFKGSYFDSFEKHIDLRRLAVTLDANAVFVKTGESIWYYRWTYTDPTSIDYRTDVLLRCKSNNRECNRLSPKGSPAEQTNMTTAGESEAVSVVVRPEDKARALYAELLTTVIEDLVKNFSKNEMVPYTPVLTPQTAALIAPVTNSVANEIVVPKESAAAAPVATSPATTAEVGENKLSTEKPGEQKPAKAKGKSKH